MTKDGIKTVGELKEFLEKLDPNMGLDLIANCYKGRNFCTIKKNIYLDRVKKNGVSIYAYTNDEDNTLVINNSNSDDFDLYED
jgi:hypothetical protein